MKFYKDKDGVVWAFEDDGSQDEFIPLDLVSITEAEADELRAPSQEQTTLNQILLLEATVTQRRLREALLGTDNGWLADIEQQIAALRAQL